MINVKVVVGDSKVSLPKYETVGSAGADVCARVDNDVCVRPGEIFAVGTGLFVEIPSGYEIQVRPRSGLAFKYGVTVLNSPGTIDHDYRGEIRVILINHGKEPFLVQNDMRIGQLVLNKVEQISWVQTDSLDETDRGSGGFGHTGV